MRVTLYEVSLIPLKVQKHQAFFSGLALYVLKYLLQVRGSGITSVFSHKGMLHTPKEADELHPRIHYIL